MTKQNEMKGKYLITTDNWFFAPDGQQYKAAWGEVEILSDDILGIKTNRIATNWFAKVGSEDSHVIVAGCQIHYSVRCEQRPDNNPLMSDDTYEGKPIKTELPSRIYFAE